jgi:hypothetical protein
LGDAVRQGSELIIADVELLQTGELAHRVRERSELIAVEVKAL